MIKFFLIADFHNQIKDKGLFNEYIKHLNKIFVKVTSSENPNNYCSSVCQFVIIYSTGIFF